MFESAAHDTREARASLAPSHVLRPRRRPGTRDASGTARRGSDHGSRVPTLDAVIVGGGPAGLSAALVLGRARRKVLVLDTGKPANAVSTGVGGLLTHSNVAPADLRHAAASSSPSTRPSRSPSARWPRSSG